MTADSQRKSTEIEEVKNLEGANEITVCPTHLLEDTPSEEDHFTSPDGIGPHERVARAIADVIISPTESGGKMIGLEGEWGSGKTTVIGLLKKKLEKNDAVTVFSYDAWAHEGDPLRRTFLESLIRHYQNLEKNGWINRKKSDRLLEDLSHRRKVTRTRTIPKATILGKVFAISVLLVPISSPLLTTALTQGVTLDTAKPFSWAFFLGVICALAPFLVLFGNCIRIISRTSKTKPCCGKNPESSIADDEEIDDWAFIGSHSIEEKKQETIETPQPTSFEFQDEFCNIMGEALQGENKRKVVMVLDNLDRVDAKDALSIWSTLQTFLQCRNDRTEDWFRKLWIIIPYDPQGLRKLWTNGSREEGIPAADDNQIVPESFMDKSFQLRFRVSPPLLTNWKAFLETLTLQALPRHSPEELHRIYQVFKLTRGDDSLDPTPRELKLYINQIGTLHRQWQHEFPLDHIAYYVILCRKRVNIRKDLLNGKLPDTTIRDVLAPNLVANLAGLCFNVTATLGQQLLLAYPIANALGKGDIAQFKELKETHNLAFWTVLEGLMTEKGAGANANQVANAALCLDSSGLLDKQTGSEKNAILAALRRSALKINNWSPFDYTVARGVPAICRLVSEPTYSSQVLITLRDTIANLPEENNVLPINGMITALVSIFEEITKIGHQDALLPFTLVTNAQKWVQACAYIHDQSEQWWPLILPKTGASDISTVFEATVGEGTFSEETLAAIEVIHRSLSNYDWNSLASTIQGRLSANQDPSTRETDLLLQGLSLLWRLGCPQAQSSREVLATSGQLMHRLHEAHAQQDVACMARLLTTFLEQQPSAKRPSVTGNSEAGYNTLVALLAAEDADLAKQIVSILDAENRITMLFEIVDQRGAYDPFVVACLRLIADSDAPGRLYTQEVVIERCSNLRDQLNKNDEGRFDRLLGYLCLNSPLVETVQRSEGGFKYQDAWLYYRICSVCSSQTFREWCQAGLEALDSTVWKAQLNIRSNVLDLLLFLIDAGISVALKQPFQDALVSHAKGILTGNAKPTDDQVNQWPKLLCALSPASRSVLRRRLLSEMTGQVGKCADAFFLIYGDELSEDATFFYEEKDIIAKLFSPLLRERNAAGLLWLSNIFRKMPDFLNESRDRDAADDFRERLQGELEKTVDSSDPVQALIMEIATTLAISTDVAKNSKEVGIDEPHKIEQEE